MNQNKNKKGFTLIELLFTIIGISIMSYYVLQSQNKKDFNDAVNVFLSNLSNILNNGVMDINKGYINSTGGDCSASISYKDLTAARVIDCAGWGASYSYGGVKDTVGHDSYFINMLQGYTSGNGCNIYLKQNGTIDDEFYAYIDCSKLNYSSNPTRYKKYMEEKIRSNIISSFSSIVKNTYPLATSIDNTAGGTTEDGKISFLMKK